MSILIWFEISLSSAIPMAVNKFTAETPEFAAAILQKGIKIQLVLALVFMGLLVLLSPLFSKLFHDELLGGFLIIAGFDIPLYAIYFITNGSINGQRRYFKLAITLSIYAVSKFVFTIALLYSWGLKGAFIGNALASLIGLTAGLYFCRTLLGKHTGFNGFKMFKFSFPVIFLAMSTHLLLNLDLFCVKLIINQSREIGLYSMAMILSRLPHLVLLALVTVLFPSLAKSLYDKNFNSNRHYIQQANRLFSLMMFPFLSILLSRAESIITLFFSTQFISAAPILRILAVAFLFYGFFSMMSYVVLANSKPYMMLSVQLVLIGIALGFNMILIPQFGLQGASFAFLITSSMAFAIGIWITSRKFKFRFNLKSTLRIMLSSVVVFGLMEFSRVLDFHIIPAMGLAGLIYVVILILLGEIKKKDFRTIVFWK